MVYYKTQKKYHISCGKRKLKKCKYRFELI
jgi:hypothetical protein